MSYEDWHRSIVQRVFAGKDLSLIKEAMRLEARSLRGHPSSLDGNMFLEAALADLEEELDRLERQAKSR